MTVLLRRRVPGVTELVYRVRQEAGKWLERTTVRPLLPVAPRQRTAAQASFFPGACDVETPRLCARETPAHVEALMRRARRSARLRFDLLGYRDLSFGTPIDWHWDPVHNRRAPRVHWSRIDPLEAAAIGDSKVTWEINRHQWLVTLAQAYRVSGDGRYASQVVGTIREWRTANPPGVGLNWASSLETAIRLIAWCWVLRLLEGARDATSMHREALAAAIAGHAAHVARNLSYYFSPNTHLTGEALALFYAGTVLEGPEADQWQALGARILVDQASRQILPDGVYFEQATCYHRYTAEIYLHFLILAEQNRVAIPPEVPIRVQRLLDALLLLCRPGGAMPQIGDADGGWLLPLAEREPDDCRGVFCTAAAIFGRPDYAWAAGALAPETVWLLGSPGVARFASLTPRPPEAPPSVALTHGGYVVMRGSWEPDAHQAVFDVGPLGCPASGGHGHADLLSLQVSPFGEPCIVDPGTGEYVNERGWRSDFRTTSAHSTVRVDGLDHARPAGPFAWSTPRPSARLSAWQRDEGLEVADAVHHAFVTPGGVVSHRRRVVFVPSAGWVVVDDLIGAGAHAMELRWQFAPLALTQTGGFAVLARLSGTRGLWVVPVSATGLTQRISLGATEPAEGWYSPGYGRRVPAPLLTYVAHVTLPTRIATVLVPQRVATATPPQVVARRDATGLLTGLQLAALGVSLTVSDKDIRSCVG